MFRVGLGFAAEVEANFRKHIPASKERGILFKQWRIRLFEKVNDLKRTKVE